MCIFDFGGGEQVEQGVFYYMKASSLKESSHRQLLPFFEFNIALQLWEVYWCCGKQSTLSVKTYDATNQAGLSFAQCCHRSSSLLLPRLNAAQQRITEDNTLQSICSDLSWIQLPAKGRNGMKSQMKHSCDLYSKAWKHLRHNKWSQILLPLSWMWTSTKSFISEQDSSEKTHTAQSPQLTSFPSSVWQRTKQ